MPEMQAYRAFCPCRPPPETTSSGECAPPSPETRFTSHETFPSPAGEPGLLESLVSGISYGLEKLGLPVGGDK